MIAYRERQCAGCLCFATRTVIDEFGEQLPLCDRCPSPDEILRRTAEVRATWDELDYWSRRYGVSRESAAHVHTVYLEEVAVIRQGLPDRHGKSMMTIES